MKGLLDDLIFEYNQDPSEEIIGKIVRLVESELLHEAKENEELITKLMAGIFLIGTLIGLAITSGLKSLFSPLTGDLCLALTPFGIGAFLTLILIQLIGNEEDSFGFYKT
jgi:hypothetical protein